MNTDTPPLGATLESFFTDYLKLQRGLRPNWTRGGYSCSLRLRPAGRK